MEYKVDGKMVTHHSIYITNEMLQKIASGATVELFSAQKGKNITVLETNSAGVSLEVTDNAN